MISYNLEWWKVYGQDKGNGGSEGAVLAISDRAEPIDFIAFQECGDKDRVIRDAGLLGSLLAPGSEGHGMGNRWKSMGKQWTSMENQWKSYEISSGELISSQ